jgi:small-conductance mechanosensitive channel
MIPDFALGSPYWEAAFGAIIFGGALAIAFLLLPLVTRVVKLLARRTGTTWDDLMLQAVNRPLFLFLLVHGFFLALTSTSYLDRWQNYLDKAWLVSMVVVLLYGLRRVTHALIQWYGQEVAVRTRSRLDEKLLPLVSRIVTVIIYAVGGLLILDNLGIELSPLLAGLGIGGLAVALALQPTLSNFFAGTYVVADGSIGVDDFIELEGGTMGQVVDIGWRVTKIQTPAGNVVIIPNGKLVDSIVTNYQSPTPEMNAVISCGVSYESDLAQVESVCLEVAKQTMEELPDSVVVKSFKPAVVFREFGDSNINFIVVLRAMSRDNTFLLTHEFIKRLHARFTALGIEINYPVRKLLYQVHDGARAPLGADRLDERQRGA